MSVTVSRGVSYTPRSAWIELICCSTADQSLVESLVLMWVAVSRGVSWINFDKEALFFTQDEVRVFTVADHLEDSRISCMA